MTGNLQKIIALAAIVLVAVIAVIAFLPDNAPIVEPQENTEKPKRAKKIPKAERTKMRAQAVAKKPEEFAKPPTGMYAHMNDEDRKVALAVQDALDAENLDRIKEIYEKARYSKNAELRRLLVEALKWFDTKAMLQLAFFLADEDEEVREAAASAWELVLANVEDEQIKLGLIMESIKMAKTESEADMIASEFNTIDQKLAVESMSKILRGMVDVSSVARQKVRETYAFITGEEYINSRVAKEWLEENYTPPEKD